MQHWTGMVFPVTASLKCPLFMHAHKSVFLKCGCPVCALYHAAPCRRALAHLLFAWRGMYRTARTPCRDNAVHAVT
jgi:hypothetical protein